MPRPRRKASSPVPVEEQGDEIETGARGLKFDQPLVGRPGRPVNVNDLLKRLKDLNMELQGIEQDEGFPQESIQKVAQELVNASILTNKDKGVKAWAACCLIEIFRITAPDAPFTQTQTKSIFEMIIDYIWPALGDPEDPYFDRYVNVLTSLDEVKSIVLLADVPGSDALTTRLFLHSFEVMSNDTSTAGHEIAVRNLEMALTGVLSSLIDESQSLPSAVVEVILAQFLRSDPNGFSLQKKSKSDTEDGINNPRKTPRAYSLATAICVNCTDRMARAISQYFSGIIVESSTFESRTRNAGKKGRRDQDSNDDDDDQAVARPVADTKELTKAHKLLRELWRSAPLVISNVIPQIEAELAAEDADIRIIAVEAVGDMISGVGAAGLAPSVPMNPAAYPSQSLIQSPLDDDASSKSFTAPASRNDFTAMYSSAYNHFRERKRDKTPQVRAAYVEAIRRVISTSAGGIGLSQDVGRALLRDFSDLLQDVDERVRLAAVQAIGRCSYHDFINKFGSDGAATDPSSVLGRLVDRAKDKKLPVRIEAVNLLGKVWGVAAGAIAEGNEATRSLVGTFPSRIFGAMFAGGSETHQVVIRSLFDHLLPLSYPPIKEKSQEKANGHSQRVKDSQASQGTDSDKVDPDAIRAQRILVLINDLDDKGKSAFFQLQNRQVKLGLFMNAFIRQCEEFNGGLNKDETVKTRLGKIMDQFTQSIPDPLNARAHLQKFADKNDRRLYHLIKFSTSPENEYRKIVNAIKEVTKRITEAPGTLQSILPTLQPLLLTSSVLVYNRSHVPAILKHSRSDEDQLGSPAHDLLKQIADNHPEVFKAQVRTMCKELIENTPKTSSTCDEGIVQTLKACASFAQKFPDEMPKDRELQQAMVQYAIHGNPPRAAKYAVSVVVASEDKKDMYIKDIVGRCVKNFKLKNPDHLSQLAALSQLMLLAAPDLEDEQDRITSIAIKDVLMSPDEPIADADDDRPWGETIDNTTISKIWALKILVNRLRGYADTLTGTAADERVREMATPVYALLQKIIDQDGRILDHSEASEHSRSRFRLTAGVLLLKLSAASKHLDNMLGPKQYNKLAVMTQDKVPEVRAGFLTALKKYLGKELLPQRFFAMTCLIATGGEDKTKEETSKWLRSRALAARPGDNAMELAMPRLISLLAHRESTSTEPGSSGDPVEYMLYYVKAVATEKNIALIYHMAQKVKSVQDGIDSNVNEDLYTLSEIAQGVVGEFADIHGWQLPALTAKSHMPSGIFAALRNHAEAQEIADKTFAPQDLLDSLEDRVKASIKTKKRRTDDVINSAKKRTKLRSGKSKSSKAVRTPAKTKSRRKGDDGDEDGSSPAVPSGERRRSSRKSNAKSYAGMDDSDEEGEEVEEEEADEVEHAASDENAASDEEVPAGNGHAAVGADMDEEEEEEEVETPARASRKKSTAKSPRVRAATKSAKERPSSTRATRARRAAQDKDEEMDDEE